MELKEINGKDLIPSEWNPRSSFDEEKLKLLRESINGIGLVEPLVVRPHPKQKGKYLITAGERRWQSKPNGKFLCLIRDESELDSKVSCLVENYVRENIADEDHEKFISNIYNEGLNSKKWDSLKQMAKKTGIPKFVIEENIRAHRERKKTGISVNVSTHDILDSMSLSDKPTVQKELLIKRAKNEIKGSGRVVRKWARELDKLPEDKALEVLKTAKDFQDVEIAVEIHEGVREPGFFVENDTLTKLERIKSRCEGIIDITPAFIDTITNVKEKEKAILFLKTTYEHIHKLLIALEEIEVVGINDKTMESRD